MIRVRIGYTSSTTGEPVNIPCPGIVALELDCYHAQVNDDLVAKKLADCFDERGAMIPEDVEVWWAFTDEKIISHSTQ